MKNVELLEHNKRQSAFLGASKPMTIWAIETEVKFGVLYPGLDEPAAQSCNCAWPSNDCCLGSGCEGVLAERRVVREKGVDADRACKTGVGEAEL